MSKTPIKKQIFLAIGLVLLIVLVLGGVKACQFRSMMAAGESWVQPATAVTTVDVQEVQWQPTMSAVGTLVASRGVMVTSEVPGIVKEIAFESGDDVKAGDVLVRIDSRSERAELASANADAKLAKADLRREQKLRNAKVSSAQTLDAVAARAAQASAQVQSVRAVLDKKVIHAPFAGHLGIRRVDVGEFVQPGQAIVPLEASEELFVDFRLPQNALGKIAAGQDVVVTTDAFADREWNGKIETVDAAVDIETRNILVRARIDNADRTLVPGMFAGVQVIEPSEEKQLVIPETAVLRAPYGDSVYLVKKRSETKAAQQTDGGVTPEQAEELVVEQVFVRIGQRRGDMTSIESGLSKGQTLVSTGAFRLQNNATVVIKNDLAPKTSENPTPENQ